MSVPAEVVDYKYIATLFLGLIGVLWVCIFTFAFFWMKFIHERLDEKADKNDVVLIRGDSVRIWEAVGHWSSHLNDAIETWRVGQEKLADKMASNHAELLKAIGQKQDRSAAHVMPPRDMP